MADIKFFGEVDIHPVKKHISSEYPAWYFDRNMDILKEEADSLERSLKKGDIPADKIADIRAQYEKVRNQYEQILRSIPKLEGTAKDAIHKARKALAAEIKDGYFSRTQMQKGTADAHKEADRMSVPMVAVKPEFAEYLRASNVPIVDGKVTRDGLVKAWKITGKLLNRHGGDEETNAEVLRRD
jgi:hypothetical protein